MRGPVLYLGRHSSVWAVSRDNRGAGVDVDRTREPKNAKTFT